MTTRVPTPVPLPLLLVNGLGALMMAAGVIGLTAPEVVPALSRPALAYALIGVGLALDLAAVTGIMKAMAKARRAA